VLALVGFIGCLGLLFVIWAFSVNSIFGIIILVTLVGSLYYFDRKDKAKNEETENNQRSIRELALNNLKNRTNFQVTKRFQGSRFVSQEIVVDENKKEVAFIDGERWGKYNYRDILKSEVVIDGEELLKTSRTSQIGGALIGGILAGGVGAIIGGLTGNQVKENNVSKVDLLLTVNDIHNPVFTLNFFNYIHEKTPIPHPIHLIKDEIEQAKQLHNVISILIRQADEADVLQEQERMRKVETQPPNTSIADEIRKLANLKEEGLLTSEEFEKQKIKLMQ
jgi:hypothetical protein